MRMSALVFIVGLCAQAFGQSSIDPALAARYFQEAKWASDDDGGKLWGKSLYGPILFVDPQTRDIAAKSRRTAVSRRSSSLRRALRPESAR